MLLFWLILRFMQLARDLMLHAITSSTNSYFAALSVGQTISLELRVL